MVNCVGLLYTILHIIILKKWKDQSNISYYQARQTRPNSGGVAEGHPRFDKGGVAIIFYFLRVKNRTFWSFYAKRLKKAYFYEFYAIKR